MHTIDEAQEWLEDIESAVNAKLIRLSEWEEGFVESVTEKGVKSQKQVAVIKKIWDRIE